MAAGDAGFLPQHEGLLTRGKDNLPVSRIFRVAGRWKSFRVPTEAGGAGFQIVKTVSVREPQTPDQPEILPLRPPKAKDRTENSEAG